MVVLVIISVVPVANWYRTGIELVLCDLPIRPQARLRCLSLAAVHRMPKYGIQVPAALNAPAYGRTKAVQLYFASTLAQVPVYVI